MAKPSRGYDKQHGQFVEKERGRKEGGYDKQHGYSPQRRRVGEEDSVTVRRGSERKEGRKERRRPQERKRE